MTIDRLDQLGQVGDLLADLTAALVRRVVQLDPDRWAPAPRGIYLASVDEDEAAWAVTMPSGSRRSLSLRQKEGRSLRFVLSARAANLWLPLARELDEGARDLLRLAAKNAGLAMVDPLGYPEAHAAAYGEAHALAVSATIYVAQNGTVQAWVAGPRLGCDWAWFRPERT